MRGKGSGAQQDRAARQAVDLNGHLARGQSMDALFYALAHGCEHPVRCDLCELVADHDDARVELVDQVRDTDGEEFAHAVVFLAGDRVALCHRMRQGLGGERVRL